ncbi:hypothetical protein G7081_06750 [Vagococcus coleopterorum]|uniref:SpaA-like prealbumin fold domain-containing protein n=1 Tax=Vagococcus coleopterorum TaxID=2714946 RepID=A0A6G8APC8_9ENTE|nr:SpaA isopeptide-forming pilin-related protein [Vagococcus coleopterorum]QIL46785.1 hypothetical protein G7081_06750 [Vagococcus coleopterorum]
MKNSKFLKILTGTMLLSMTITLAYTTVFANDDQVNGIEFIRDAKLRVIDSGEFLKDGDSIEKDTPLELLLKWEISSDNSKENLRHFFWDIPDNLKVNSAPSELLDENGDKIASLELNEEFGRLELTLDDNKRDLSESYHGEIVLPIEITKPSNINQMKTKLDISLFGKSSLVVFIVESLKTTDHDTEDDKESSDEGLAISKTGEIKGSKAFWTIKVSPQDGCSEASFIKDFLGRYQQFVEGSLVAKFVKYHDDGSYDVIEDLDTTGILNKHHKVFFFWIGRIEADLLLTYETNLSGMGKVPTYHNDVLLGWGHNQKKFIQSQIYNPLNQTKLTVEVVDAAKPNKRLGVSEFELVNMSTGERELLKTNQDGKLVCKDLEYSDYQLIQKNTKNGYEISKNPYSFTLSQNNNNVNLIIKNKAKKNKGIVHVVKFDNETGKRLEGAEFILKNMNGDVLSKFKTDENGEYWSDELAYGKYEIIETKAPKGYKLFDK